ncbi:MAG TPA: hypothetical protein VEG34_05730 [Thermoanaerobaculia bacterium]|nr:hypothetical protein [Thermoanaerobaculia bacterium]
MTTLDASRAGAFASAETPRAGDFAAPAAVDRIQKLGLLVAGGAALLSLLGWFVAPGAFVDTLLRSYLVAWVYWMGVSLGCFALLMIHHLSRGGWGVVARRILEAATRTLPLLLVLALPLFLLGLPRLYLWAQPGGMATDAILQHKAQYLNVKWFLIRQALYFAVWLIPMFVINRLSRQQDETGDPLLFRRMQKVAAPGLLAYALAVNFASVDWLMSLQPHWYSTIYGVYLMGSQALAALAFVIVVALFLARREPMSRVFLPRHFHDYGKLFLAATMLWAYFSFSQFLIIWAGNLPEEIEFYLERMRHGWGVVAVAVVLLHFILPFLLLLSSDLKRTRGLGAVAILMLVARLVELFWQVEPAFEHHEPALYWLYLTVPLALGGLWLFWFMRELKKRPLVPINDPYLPEAMADAHH